MKWECPWWNHKPARVEGRDRPFPSVWYQIVLLSNGDSLQYLQRGRTLRRFWVLERAPDTKEWLVIRPAGNVIPSHHLTGLHHPPSGQRQQRLSLPRSLMADRTALRPLGPGCSRGKLSLYATQGQRDGAVIVLVPPQRSVKPCLSTLAPHTENSF